MATPTRNPTDTTTETPTESLLIRAAELEPGSSERARLIERVVQRHAWLIRVAAGRYSGRGEDYDVLRQEAYVGLLEAIDRFDPERGPFRPFAKITVFGLLRRHFRDRRRWIQIPRRLQEVQAGIRNVHDELTQSLGHEPSNAELATRLSAVESDVAEAGAATFRPISLDAPAGTEEDGDTLGDRLGTEDAGIAHSIDLEAVRTVATELPLRQRKILLLRFFGDYTQREIAERVDLSQMHVSRLITDACRRLRDRVLETRPDTDDPYLAPVPEKQAS